MSYNVIPNSTLRHKAVIRDSIVEMRQGPNPLLILLDVVLFGPVVLRPLCDLINTPL